ncbi:TonB-dependent receptor [Helicobacter sp. 13S00477-4]|uniref:TonB-dependent receptor n=1 Tax=Helicobacter sp. 13S00477-4 TaxID=1905759 RepID=UPI000BA7A1D6|nr:TonB-dependent receptor [Helicobacter sp. 13S00477-4]PAF52457.1 hypothetical protein BKH44_02745 [Helicobacter sp. 13S00477-4]
MNKLYKTFVMLIIALQTLSAIDEQEATLNKVVTSATGFDMQLKDEARNMLVIDKPTLTNKGYQTLDDALRYVPLLTFSNNGFGENIDLRGQGDKANTAIKVLINRVPINLLDTSHGITPIGMINIEDVESIEVIPGGGAVVYGNGTRGGVINIVTKQNPKDFANFALKGGSYETKNGLFGRADVSAGKKITQNLFLKADISVANTSGYRQGDSLFNYYVALETLYKINQNQSIHFNASYSHSLTTTSPALSLTEVKKDRTAIGDGRIISPEDFVSTSIDYRIKTDSWHFDLLGFYQMDNLNYTTNIMTVSTRGINTPFDNSGSRFFNQGAGLNAKAKYISGNNTLMFGYDLLYQNAYRKEKAHYNVNSSSFKLDHSWTTDLKNNKLANSIYILEKYNFGDKFDLTGGVRYENSYYTMGRDKTTRMIMSFTRPAMPASGSGGTIGGGAMRPTPPTAAVGAATGIPPTKPATSPIKTDPHYSKNTFRNNYALELTPNFKYSSTGNIYAKYERGFITPGPNQLTNSDKTGIYYNGLKPEVYDTFELGWKDEFTYSYLSATLYYTLTQDEININQITHGSVWTYTNLDQTQRIGIELVAIQDLFDSDSLHLNESISYLDAHITKGLHKGKRVPLARDYKITFGIAYDIIKNPKQLLSIFTNNSFFGSAIDTSYTKMNAYNLTDLGINYKFGSFKFNAGVRNIFDSQYYSYQLATSADMYIPAGYIPAAGRSYYAELRYDF